ncbi:MAG TPA: hypothetical protein VKD43_04585 [Xanthobacteraceae bacterium]|nr:hypothetical protein [Xanthobacteraceae bacterium]
MKIDSLKLTTCGVTADGGTVELGFVDSSGAAVCVRLPFDQAEAVVMTLPSLLARALQRRTGKPEARYVSDLGEWSVEGAKAQNCLIVTLKTPDGFEVSFGIPFAACRSLGWTLKREADEAQELAGDRLAADRIRFN